MWEGEGDFGGEKNGGVVVGGGGKFGGVGRKPSALTTSGRSAPTRPAALTAIGRSALTRPGALARLPGAVLVVLSVTWGASTLVVVASATSSASSVLPTEGLRFDFLLVACVNTDLRSRMSQAALRFPSTPGMLAMDFHGVVPSPSSLIPKGAPASQQCCLLCFLLLLKCPKAFKAADFAALARGFFRFVPALFLRAPSRVLR